MRVWIIIDDLLACCVCEAVSMTKNSNEISNTDVEAVALTGILRRLRCAFWLNKLRCSYNITKETQGFEKRMKDLHVKLDGCQLFIDLCHYTIQWRHLSTSKARK